MRFHYVFFVAARSGDEYVVNKYFRILVCQKETVEIYNYSDLIVDLPISMI